MAAAKKKRNHHQKNKNNSGESSTRKDASARNLRIGAILLGLALVSGYFL